MKELRGKQSGSPMGLIDFKISIVNLYQYSTVPRKSMTEVEEGLCELLCLDGLLGLGLEARQPAPVHFKFFLYLKLMII